MYLMKNDPGVSINIFQLECIFYRDVLKLYLEKFRAVECFCAADQLVYLGGIEDSFDIAICIFRCYKDAVGIGSRGLFSEKADDKITSNTLTFSFFSIFGIKKVVTLILTDLACTETVMST